MVYQAHCLWNYGNSPDILWKKAGIYSGRVAGYACLRDKFQISKLHFPCAVRAALRLCVCVCAILLTPWITFVNCIRCFRPGVPKWRGQRVSCCVFTCLAVADRFYLSGTTLNSAISRVIPVLCNSTSYSTVLQINKLVQRLSLQTLYKRRKF